jgi:hypothetical protein
MRQHLALHAATTLAASTLLLACSGGGGELDDNEPLADAGADADTQGDGGETSGAVITPRFEPDGEGFYRTPWPSDTRVKEGGEVDLRDFPNATSLIIRVFRPELEKIEGFSIVPVVYVGLDASPGNSSMPNPRETVEADGSVQLIALDDACGERTPLDVDVDAVGDKYIDPNTLRATPEPGFVLAPRRRYALVVLEDFDDDVTIARPPAFDEAMRGEGALAEHFAPLRECLESDELDADRVAVATVFTTQDTTSVMRRMREVVLEDIDAPTVSDWRLTPDEALEEFDVTRSDVYTLYDGTIEAPIFQVGQSPYRSPGTGGLELDAAGVPQIQRQEVVPFSVAVPAGEFEGPRPVMLFEDGTGGDHYQHLGNRIVRDAIAEGFVVVNFVPQFHGGRDRMTYDEIVSQTFNYLNPAAGRTVFRQQAAETIYASRLIRESLAELEGVPELDLTHLVYGGHSQGALVGGIVAGVSDEFSAYGMNGLGAYTATTIVYRKDYVDVEKTLRDAAQVERPLDLKHPVVHLAQLGTDVIDPMAYAPFWAGVEGGNAGAHVFVTNGGRDETSSPVGMTGFTLAAGLDIIEAEAAWNLDPYNLSRSEGVAVPFGSNRTGAGGQPLTHATYIIESQGHFSMFRSPRAAEFMLNFWTSAADGVPVVRSAR